ncbi:hypothetical protein AB0A63_36980 [Lentzea sp. NPDC042327]|uniref:hypothetical protein n=1 Tax=Lentzea sp. NPDC042327 TaxID=3154801 RepID=UPI003405A97F
MAADPFARLADRQHSLRTALRALQATHPGSPELPALLADTDREVQAVVQARRDVESARLTVPNRVVAAVTAVAALTVVIGWFDPWSLVSVVLALAVAAAVLVDPTGTRLWEPRARTAAISAALAGVLLTPVLRGWAALAVVAGGVWWAWRTLR